MRNDANIDIDVGTDHKKSDDENTLRSIITSSLEYLADLQSVDGSFITVSLNTDSVDEAQENRHTTFATSLILQTLARLGSIQTIHKDLEKENIHIDIDTNPQTISQIIHKGAQFLLKEQKPDGTWNYWQHEAEQYLVTPDDMDATSCAFDALALNMSDFVSGENLGNYVKLLLATELQEGGPYNTWLMPAKNPDEPLSIESPWYDKDIAVNANILLTLARQEVILPNLTDYISEAISADTLASKYYFSPIIILYFISRAFATIQALQTKSETDLDPELEIDANKAIQKILSIRTDGHWSNTLETAMAISALYNFNYFEIDQRAINFLLEEFFQGKQQDMHSNDASWRAHPLYVQRSKDGKTMYSGGAALTTVFCIEALHLSLRHGTQHDIHGIAKIQKDSFHTQNAAAMQFNLEVEKLFLEFCSSISADISELGKKTMVHIRQKDPGQQITLLPYIFTTQLLPVTSTPSTPSINDRSLELGLANICGWIAYDIYDDILDGEGAPELLPLANLCLQKVYEIYMELLPVTFRPLFIKMMQEMDAANFWERKYARFDPNILFDSPADKDSKKLEDIPLPDYGDLSLLAKKSMPHCLSAITSLAFQGHDPDDVLILHTIDFFRHYLIARQLNDDAHDWLSDLKHGFINAASAEVIMQYRIDLNQHENENHVQNQEPNKGQNQMKVQPADSIEEQLQKIFWHTSADKLVQTILDHIQKARTSLDALSVAVAEIAGTPKTSEKISTKLTEKNNCISYLAAQLLPLEKAAHQVIEEKKKTLDFLKAYTANRN